MTLASSMGGRNRWDTACQSRDSYLKRESRRNGPGLASWLKAHPGWHVVAESVNRRAAWAAAWKIRHGERRGFEDGLWDAQAQNRDGRWGVSARRASKRRSIPGEGMDPLF